MSNTIIWNRPPETNETDVELLNRYRHVKSLVVKANKRVERLKSGSAARTRAVMWAGSIYFTQLHIESEMSDRNIVDTDTRDMRATPK